MYKRNFPGGFQYQWVGGHSLNISSSFQRSGTSGYCVISITKRQSGFLKSQFALNHVIHFHRVPLQFLSTKKCQYFYIFFCSLSPSDGFWRLLQCTLLLNSFSCFGSWMSGWESGWSRLRFPFHSDFTVSSLQWFWNSLNLYSILTLLQCLQYYIPIL